MSSWHVNSMLVVVCNVITSYKTSEKQSTIQLKILYIDIYYNKQFFSIKTILMSTLQIIFLDPAIVLAIFCNKYRSVLLEKNVFILIPGSTFPEQLFPDCF